MAQTNGDAGLTLTVLGCGTMGIAILSGILSSLSDLRAGPGIAPSQTLSASGTAMPLEDLPERLPSRFLACVRRPESAKKIKAALAPHAPTAPLTVLVNDNLAGARAADVVLLACKPQMFREVLSAPGIKDALAGKLLISILAGVTSEQIQETLYGSLVDRLTRANNSMPSSSSSSTSSGEPNLGLPPDACRVIRAMPNTASFVRESMTVIATPSPPLPPPLSTLTTWIFTRIGRVVHLPASSMDASTAVCGSGPAFMALVLEAVADGGVAMGLPRAEAQLMAAQTMRGAAALVLGGEHPAILRDKVSTPGGCTIGGLLVLEEGRVRGTVARAVREATVVAGQLGKGVTGVNGTRF